MGYLPTSQPIHSPRTLATFRNRRTTALDIPARDMFGYKPGDDVLLLAGPERGIAILPADQINKLLPRHHHMFPKRESMPAIVCTDVRRTFFPIDALEKGIHKWLSASPSYHTAQLVHASFSRAHGQSPALR